MFTPESLLATAADAEKTYEERCILFPAGTYDEQRNDAYTLMAKALACAAWMERHGHKELSHVGPFGDVTLRRGDRIRVRKGSVIFSSDPAVPRNGIVSERASVVTLRSIDHGYVDHDGLASRPSDISDGVRQPRVNWSGSGRFWRWTDIANVEAVL